MRAALIPYFATAAVLSALTAIAGEPHRTIDASRALDAATPPSAAGPIPEFKSTPTPPDPSPLTARKQWIFDLRWDRGEIWLLEVRPVELPEARVTPRAMGRFALELLEGQALVERVRFDFPLLGALEPEGAPSLTGRLRTRIGVLFPATARGARLELVDRATHRRWSLAWPPLPSKQETRDAGALPQAPDGAANTSAR